MKKLNRFFATYILVALSLLLLTACGGGGDNSPPNNTKTDWDQLVWDQDNWS